MGNCFEASPKFLPLNMGVVQPVRSIITHLRWFHLHSSSWIGGVLGFRLVNSPELSSASISQIFTSLYSFATTNDIVVMNSSTKYIFHWETQSHPFFIKIITPDLTAILNPTWTQLIKSWRHHLDPFPNHLWFTRFQTQSIV